MAIRQDQAQLIITIDSKESAEYQKSVQRSLELTRNIKKMEVGTKEYNTAITEQASLSKKLVDADYSKLSLKNLLDRKRALQEQIKILPQATAAELGLTRELQQVNQALSENAQRTRAVNTAMDGLAKGGFWNTIKTNVLSVAGGFAIFDVARKTISSLIGVGRDSLKLFDEQAKADAQLKAAITSTNNAAGRSFEQLKKQASDLQKVTLFGDEQTQQAQGVLLTFTKVREEIFDRSIPAIQDYATAMGTDLKGASIQVGKALNDPIKGISALGKAGVQFSEEQKETINQLVKTGDVAAAQSIILGELETQFKGSAEAAAKAGLGPYQQLTNRLSDVKESFGELIEKGLKIAAPFFESVVTIVEKFVTSLTSGEKATGEFSMGINYAIGLLKIIVGAIRGVINVVGSVITKIGDFITEIRKIEIVNRVIEAITAPFRLFYNLIANTSAAVAGLRAAMQQAFDNISKYIKKTLLDLQIFAKELDKTLSFKSSTKERIDKEINDLKSQRNKFAETGKTVAQAYTDAFNGVIEKESKAKKIVDSLNDRVGTRPTIEGDDSDPTNPKAKAAKAPKEAKTKSSPSLNVFDPKFLEAQINMALKILEDGTKRELAILEESFLQGQITQDEYEIERLRIAANGTAARIELLDRAGLQETDKRRELNIQLLKLDADLVKERADQIADMEATGLTELQRQFAERLIGEEEYNIRRLELQISFYDQQLALLEENGLIETEVYARIQDAKLQKQIEINKQREENEKRTQELMFQAQQQGFGAAADIFQMGSELLGQDEKARRKHASAIKAFEVAQVKINLASEIAGIWRNAQQNPINALIPGWGTVFSGIQAGFAVGRAAINIGRIAGAQYYKGGKIKSISGGLINEAPNIPTLPGGDNIVIAAKRGEVVLNDQQQNMLGGAATFRAIGVPGFNTGGVIGLPNTTPNINGQILNPVAAAAATSEPDPNISALASAVEMLANIMPDALSNIKANVNYFDIENKGTELNEVRRLASF